MSSPVLFTAAVFLGYLCLSIVSSLILADGVNRISARLTLKHGLFGIVTALAADSPEISSAVIAILGGHHDLSLGVVFGLNIFNLAARLGLSAVVSSRVGISRSRLFLNGIAGLLILGIVIGLLLCSLTPPVAAALTALVCIPYVIIMRLQPAPIRRFFPPGWLRDFLCSGLICRAHGPRDQAKSSSAPKRRHAWMVSMTSSESLGIKTPIGPWR